VSPAAEPICERRSKRDPKRPPGRQQGGGYAALVVVSLAVLASLFLPARADEATTDYPREIPRVIIGLHDGEGTIPKRTWPLHHFAEMPLNHLGLIVEYHSVNDPLPDLSGRRDVRGIVYWPSNAKAADPAELVRWLIKAAESDLPIALFHTLPAGPDGRTVPYALEQRLYAKLGMRLSGDWRPYAFDLQVKALDRRTIGFERMPAPPFTPPPPVRAQEGNATGDETGNETGAQALLTLSSRPGLDLPAREIDPIVRGRNSLFVAPGYAVWFDGNFKRKQWYIDPFTLFSDVFRTRDMPKPDTTTLNGRRIYYSHIDGDGWLNLSEADGYAGKSVNAARVILHEVAEAYPDLPLTVAPIAAELDPEYLGTPEAVAETKAFFRLPNVEPASHTYTHPFQWSFFDKGYQPSDEDRFAEIYREGYGAHTHAEGGTEDLDENYTVPRAYGGKPFSLNQETAEAAELISRLAPADKPVRLIQWSGDTTPFEAAIAAAREAKLYNINGGDTLFYFDAPSYTHVAPLGRRVGAELQVYASHANDNLYSELWYDRFFGMRHVLESFERTETPRRVKPLNLYYHMFSGEREASLRALKDVLDAVRTMEIAPVSTSHFAAIVGGAFSARMTEIAPNRYEISERGALQTLRFDERGTAQVDPARSRGVLGWRHEGTTLYIHLDPSERTVVVQLTEEPQDLPSLHDSRWRISGLTREGDLLRFAAHGYGRGAMTWRVPPGSRWLARLLRSDDTPLTAAAQANEKGFLTLDFPPVAARDWVRIELERVGATP